MNALTRAVSIVAVVLAAALLSGCAWDANAAPGSTSLTGDTVVIEAAWDGDLPIVDTYIDGHGPFRFLLDTGAETTIVSPACAEAAGLRTEAAALNISSAGAARDRATRTAVLDDLRLGDARFSGVPAIVLEAGSRIDGVLGFPLFADLLLTLDGPGGRLLLTEGELVDGDGSLPLAADDDQALPSPRVFGRIGGERARILIDSGFDGFLFLSGGTPESIDMAFVPDQNSEASAETGDGRRTVYLGRLDEVVEVGSHRYEGVPTVVAMGPGTILGGAFLRGLVTTFDQRSRRVRFALPE